MKRIIGLILMLIIALTCFAACNKSEATNDTANEAKKDTLEGYWKGDFDGETVVFSFEENKEGVMYFTSGGYDFYVDVEWETDGNTFSLTADGATQTFEYSLTDGKLNLGGDILEKATADDVPESAINVDEIIEDTKE